MRTIMIAISALFLTMSLSACDQMNENVGRASDDVKQAYDGTRLKLSDWFYRRNASYAPERPYQPARYCYRVQSDILCYDKPQEELRTRLVGYQGDDAIAPEEYAAVMQQQEEDRMHEAYYVEDQMYGPDAVSAVEVGSPFQPATDETMAKAASAPTVDGSVFVDSAPYIASDSDAPKVLMEGH